MNLNLLFMKQNSRIDQLVSIQPDTKSGTTPPAQSATVLQPWNEYGALQSKLMAFIASDKVYPAKLKYLLWFMFWSGARVSECLALRGIDVKQGYIVHFRGLKGSNDRFVNVMPLQGLVLPHVGEPVYLFSEFSRFYVYRLCKSLGLYFTKAGHKHASVTHSFRNAYAAKLLNMSDSKEQVGKAIGHKSQRSINYYGEKIKK